MGRLSYSYGEVGSTNDLAKEAAKDGADHGTLYVAERQTEGRGRQGKTWHAEPGCALLCSLVMRLPLAASALSPLTLAAGLGVCEVVQAFCGGKAQVKWPNDVLVDDRKLAGILVELVSTPGAEHSASCVVVGIGLNLRKGGLPPEVASLATSLEVHCGQPPSRELLLAQLCQSLESWVDAFVSQGPRGLSAALRKVDALRGRSLRVGRQVGTGAGISEDGALLLDIAGKLLRVSSGTVELLRACEHSLVGRGSEGR